MKDKELETLNKILEKIKDVCDTKTKFHSENEKDSETIHRLVEAYCFMKMFGEK